jgi:Zn finger protein HypA/HybF involved in hydrogenase expression
MDVVALNRTLEQEVFALARGASLECLACGEFVLHRACTIECPECGSRLEGGQVAGAGLVPSATTNRAAG